MENVIIEDVDVREFVTLNLKCIHFYGYFWPRFEEPSTKRTLYRIYALTFILVAFVLSLLSQIAKMIESMDDMEKMTDASFLLLTNVVQSIKIFCFNIHRPKVWDFVEGMNRDCFKPRSSEQREIILDGIRMSKFITIQFFMACAMTCAAWGVSPLFDKSKQSENGLELPLSGWYPFSVEKSPGFEIAYVYQCVVTLVGGLGNISMDTFISGSIMVICTQLSMLNNSLKNMRLQVEETGFRFSKKLDDVNKLLVYNVIHYKNILQFADDCTYLFTASLTGNFVIGVIIVCVSMFQMSLVPVLSFRFFAMALYQICILVEIGLWCYYGNEVILKSDDLTQSAYICDWVDAPKEFKQNLLFFMTRTQVPLRLYAAGYFMLSLETFKAIVKSSWSYFAVLNQVHSDEAI